MLFKLPQMALSVQVNIWFNLPAKYVNIYLLENRMYRLNKFSTIFVL